MNENNFYYKRNYFYLGVNGLLRFQTDAKSLEDAKKLADDKFNGADIEIWIGPQNSMAERITWKYKGLDWGELEVSEEFKKEREESFREMEEYVRAEKGKKRLLKLLGYYLMSMLIIANVTILALIGLLLNEIFKAGGI